MEMKAQEFLNNSAIFLAFKVALPLFISSFLLMFLKEKPNAGISLMRAEARGVITRQKCKQSGLCRLPVSSEASSGQ